MPVHDASTAATVRMVRQPKASPPVGRPVFPAGVRINDLARAARRPTPSKRLKLPIWAYEVMHGEGWA